MFGNLRIFVRDENGAVTVDWVVLTAAIAFMGVAVVTGVLNSSTSVSNGIGVNIEKQGDKHLP